MSEHKQEIHIRYDGLAVPEIYVDDEWENDENDEELEDDSDDEIDFDDVAVPEFHPTKHKK